MNTSTKLWMTPTWATQSSGRTAATAPSTSFPRTRRSWQSAGASAKATARPWPIKRWQELWETTAAPGRSSKCAANSPTSSTQTSCTGSAPLRCPCTCPATQRRRKTAPSSKTLSNRATADLQQQTGTTGTDTTSCTRTMNWPPTSPHTPQPKSELHDGLSQKPSSRNPLNLLRLFCCQTFWVHIQSLHVITCYSGTIIVTKVFNSIYLNILCLI